MFNQQYCKLGNQTIRKKNKFKHDNSQKHKENENMIIYRNFVEKLVFFKIREINEEHSNEFLKNYLFGFLNIILY